MLLGKGAGRQGSAGIARIGVSPVAYLGDGQLPCCPPICFLSCSSGPGGPGRPSKRWGASPPTFLRAFPGPRGRPDCLQARLPDCLQARLPDCLQAKNAPQKIRPDCLQVPSGLFLGLSLGLSLGLPIGLPLGLCLGLFIPELFGDGGLAMAPNPINL